MQEQQEKIPNGQRGADSAGPTARGRQRRAGPLWPISARSSARPVKTGRSPRRDEHQAFAARRRAIVAVRGEAAREAPGLFR